MELEHSLQQPGVLAAFQLMIVGILLAPAMFLDSGLYDRFARAFCSWALSLGPIAILVYALYRVSRFS